MRLFLNLPPNSGSDTTPHRVISNPTKNGLVILHT